MRRATRVSWLVATMLGVSVLGACAPTDGVPETETSATARPSLSPSPSATDGVSTPSAEPSPSVGKSIPLSIACGALVDGATIYDLNPNLGLDPSYRPTGLAVTVIDSDGVSCGWINQTSGDMVAVSVASFDDAGLAATRDAVSDRGGSPTPGGFGGEGVFRTEGSVGVLELVRAPYWILIQSPMFGSAAEAEIIVDEISKTLP